MDHCVSIDIKFATSPAEGYTLAVVVRSAGVRANAMLPPIPTMPPILGEMYTRRQIAAMHGGNIQMFLPRVDGRVVCACLRKEPGFNPEAPEVILPGQGPVIEGSAATLGSQGGSIPIYLRHDTNAWKFVGYFEVENYSQEPAELARYGAMTHRTVTSVIRMHRVA